MLPSFDLRISATASLAVVLAPILVIACAGRLSGRSGPVADGGAEADVEGGAIGTVTAPDCPGCSFPPAGASPCSSAPSIKIMYPPDGALLPPNLGVLSVQWVPYGTPFERFEVELTQTAEAPPTDWRIVTACSAQTTDSQGQASAGCETAVDPASWSAVAAANRGGGAITITVRGTTDGVCASTSENSIRISLSEQDVLGTYFYWKTYSDAHGTGGQLWGKAFGDPTAPEQQLLSPALQTLCVGCHAISRDGSRMLLFAVDDTDADYEGLGGTALSLSGWPAQPPTELAADAGAGTQPPGWTAFSPAADAYVTSNGLPCTTSGGLCAQSEVGVYPGPVAANDFSLWNGGTAGFAAAVSMAAPGIRPTMPEWSVDGTSVVYVQPSAVGSWDGSRRNDDDHVFGGSLYTSAYMGNGAFGPPGALVVSKGENNYYPSYSPDVPASYVLFDRAPLDTSVSTLTGCNGVIPKATCPNDSFANPAARLMLVPNATGGAPIDLEAANGSPAAIHGPLSNSFPRFLPFVQTYEGKTLMWLSFSSTRDYGLRVLNHKDGMYPCYPPDSLEWPGSQHNNVIDPACQQPQLWIAPVLFRPGQPPEMDPSGVAIWLPYQDITTHNHMATWSWAAASGSCQCSMSGAACGPANGGCGCCHGLVCSGEGACLEPPM
jgi:hypothetical protein